VLLFGPDLWERKSGFLYSFPINQVQIRFKSALISSESSTLPLKLDGRDSSFLACLRYL